jgi:hypothetical protein
VNPKNEHGPFRAHVRQRWRLDKIFHSLFYGRAKFCCKTMQRYEMQRKSDSFRYL